MFENHCSKCPRCLALLPYFLGGVGDLENRVEEGGRDVGVGDFGGTGVEAGVEAGVGLFTDGAGVEAGVGVFVDGAGVTDLGGAGVAGLDWPSRGSGTCSPCR